MAKFVPALMKQLIKYSQARLSHWSFYWNSRLAQDRVDLWMALSRSKESSSPQHLPFRPHTHRNLGYLINKFGVLQEFAVILRYLLSNKSIKPYYQFIYLSHVEMHIIANSPRLMMMIKIHIILKIIVWLKRVSPMKPLNFKYLDNFHKKSKIWMTLLDH